MKQLWLLGMAVLLCGCTDAGYERQWNWENCKVTLYSGGKEVRTWHSTGVVQSESRSDGYHFKDKATGKLIVISGDIVIESEE